MAYELTSFDLEPLLLGGAFFGSGGGGTIESAVTLHNSSAKEAITRMTQFEWSVSRKPLKAKP
jgi:DUF917 family protein